MIYHEKESTPADRHGVIINLSNHRIPKQAFEFLEKNYDLSTFAVFSTPTHFDFELDLWDQIEEIGASLRKKYNAAGENCYTNEGRRFIFLPAATIPSALIALFFTRLFGQAPYICLVHRNNKGNPVLKQVVNAEALCKRARNHWRAELVLNQ